MKLNQSQKIQANKKKPKKYGNIKNGQKVKQENLQQI